MAGKRAVVGPFSYALVSAAPLHESDATGIGIIFKAEDRSTVHSICTSVHASELRATYEAILMVLDAALGASVGRPAIYVDSAEAVAQIEGRVPVPRDVLGAHLQTRAIMNQVGRPRLIAATRSPNFSARKLAQCAAPAHARRSRPARQLRLMPETPG